VPVRRVKLRDRGAGAVSEWIRFTSALLPHWARQPRSLDATPPSTKAVTCLLKNRDALLTFYDYPAEHWDHLRTSNPIESAFANVRHRTVRTKDALSQGTARLTVFELVMSAAKTWRRLKGGNQSPKVVQGVRFRNGVEVNEAPAQAATQSPA
jgi:hypothetical protein